MTYQMSGEGDKNNLDHVTRERMYYASEDDSKYWSKVFFFLFVFIAGMIFGSSIHDNVLHGILK